MPPEKMLTKSNEKKLKMWFKKGESNQYSLKTLEDLEKEGLKSKIKVRKMCYDIKNLDDISLVISQLNEENETKLKKPNSKGECFVHFLKGILRWEPELRYTPSMALQHPFITGLEFDSNFVPISDEIKEEEKKTQQYVSLIFITLEILPRISPN